MFTKEPVPLPVVYDALQALNKRNASGVLYMSVASGCAAALVLQDGKVTKTGFDDLRGLEALDKLKQEDTVRYAFRDNDQQLSMFMEWPENITQDALNYLTEKAPFLANTQAVDRINIMVVDDSVMVRNVVKHTVGKHNYSIIEVADGETALQKLEHMLPDVVLLDLVLPGMDGYSVLEKMRQTPALAQVSVIILTSSDEQMHQARQGQFQADEYLHKPFQPDQLMTVLESFID